MYKKNELYRIIPKMDVLLKRQNIIKAVQEYGKKPVMDIIRFCLDRVREEIENCNSIEKAKSLVGNLDREIDKGIVQLNKKNYKHVINGTGVVLHTNLGRAPMSEKAVQNVAELMTRYGNLEYNLKEGTRGERYNLFEDLVCNVIGSEAAFAVNNNAAAVLLMISSLASGKEVLISRGEQIEIGGKFRIPDIIRQSGAVLHEVGTTNRTRISDYEDNINDNTGAILKVHTSNFVMKGFTESVPIKELVKLGRKYNIPVLEDLGSGVLADLSSVGLKKEPTVQDSIDSGVDLVTFSGDKLMGGPQAGILAGRKELIDQCKKHPLTRAIRIDKFTAAMLEETFAIYQDLDFAMKNIPVLHMLSQGKEELEEKAKKFKQEMIDSGAQITIEECTSVPGGGALPDQKIESICVRIKKQGLQPEAVAGKLREGNPALITLVREDSLIIDMRTVFDEEISMAAQLINQIL